MAEYDKNLAVAGTHTLETKGLRKRYGRRVVVKDVSLRVKSGEVVGLLGPNGAGKTTAFNVVTGVYAPTNGAVWFEGRKIIENTPHGKMKKLYKGETPLLYTSQYDPGDETKEQMLARDPLAGTGKIVSPTPDKITKLGIARTFQNIRLWKSMTVFENVLVAKHMRARQNVFSATFRGNAKEEKRMRDETMALLVEQGLEKYSDDIATSLPYGIQRRLEIARALATDPKLLLLDEPAAGMNPQETLELAAFIHELRDKYDLTIFLIEHHMDLVMRISDYIYVIDFGSKIAEGIPQEVQNNQHVIDAYLGVVEDE